MELTKRCDFCKERLQFGVESCIGEGDPSSKIWFITEAPVSGRALPTKERNKLFYMLRELGLSPGKDVFLTPSIRVPKPSKQKNPHMEQLRQCRGCFDQLLLDYNPELIVCLGEYGWKQLTDDGQQGVQNNRRKVFHYQGVPVVVTYEIDTVLKAGQFEWYVLADLEDYIRTKGKKEPYDIEYTVGDKVNEFICFQNPLALDVETTGFDITQDNLLCCGIGGMDSPAIQVVTGNYDKLGKTVINNPDHCIVGANIQFDLQWFLKDREIPKCSVHDIQFMHYLLDENYPTRRLKHLHLVYTDLEDYEPDKLPFELEPDELYKYNAKDIESTRQVYPGVINELDEQEVDYHKTLTLFSRVQPILSAMERTGIPVDRDRLNQEMGKAVPEIEKLKDTLGLLWAEHSNSSWINLNSHAQLSRFIFDSLGANPPDIKNLRNKDGSISTREDILKKTEDPTGFIETFRQYQKASKGMEYMENVAEALARDGRVHPTYRAYKTVYGGTETGRLSVSNPPIHNIPKKHPIRKAFVPFTEDGFLIQMDLSQIELVGLAYQSQDRELINAITNEEDLHMWMANHSEEIGYPISRDEAKIFNYGILYGISPKGIVEQTSLDRQDVAKRILNHWYDRFSTVRRWQEQTKRDACRGYVETHYGRRRMFPEINRRSWQGRKLLRQATNFPIQAWASDVNLMILRDMSKHSDIAFPLTAIHDSIVWAVDGADEYLQFMDILEDYWENDLLTSYTETFGAELNIPITGDIVAGSNWYETESVDGFTTKM